MKKSKFPYMVLIPMLLLLTVFVVIPIIASFAISFMDYNPLRQSGNVFVGFKNYSALFSDARYKASLVNTLYYVLAMVTINICVTLVTAAILCSLESNKWRSLFRTFFFMPCVAPLAAISVVWQKSLFGLKGGFNMMIKALGGRAIDWLGNPAMIMPSIILLSLWAEVGYNTILFISGIQGIPGDYYEAAEIDGAGPVRRFFDITLPLLRRTFIFVSSMTFISQFQAFAQFAILTSGGGAGYSGQVLSTYIYYQGFAQKEMGYASAISVTLFIMILIVTLIQQRFNRVDWGY